jgi:hypothetical protein
MQLPEHDSREFIQLGPNAVFRRGSTFIVNPGKAACPTPSRTVQFVRRAGTAEVDTVRNSATACSCLPASGSLANHDILIAVKMAEALNAGCKLLWTILG